MRIPRKWSYRSARPAREWRVCREMKEVDDEEMEERMNVQLTIKRTIRRIRKEYKDRYPEEYEATGEMDAYYTSRMIAYLRDELQTKNFCLFCGSGGHMQWSCAAVESQNGSSCDVCGGKH